MATYKYFQPEYVSKFQCDGQACTANCCCKSWIVIIDEKTYQKYLRLESKSAAREITRYITKNESASDYILKFNENNRCPFLTEDKFCGIQRKYGEEFLSEICATYPRITWDIGKFYERSLTLTCPIATKLILLATEPLKFERVEIPEKIHNRVQIRKFLEKLPKDIQKYLISLQETSTAILQERSLTIDRRLLMLGLYCDKIAELMETGNSQNIENIAPIYQNKNFLQEQAAQFSAFLKFNAHEHIKIMLGLFETLYGKGNFQTPEDRKFIDAVMNVLQIKPDDTSVKISALTEKYLLHSQDRQKFLNRFETIFENYLVNEFFMNLYPFRFNGSTIFNYGVFVAIYKMLELLTLSTFVTNENFDESDFIVAISWYAGNIDHNISYVNKIKKYLENKVDTVDIMQSMLQL